MKKLPAIVTLALALPPFSPPNPPRAPPPRARMRRRSSSVSTRRNGTARCATVSATEVGDPRYNDRWPDLSLAAIERSTAADRAALERLSRIDVSGLSAADRMTFDIVKLQFEEQAAVVRFKPWLYAVDHQGDINGTPNPQTASDLAEVAPFQTVRDYDNWIARLNAFGPFVDQVIALLDAGVREGRTAACAVTVRIPAEIAAQRVASPSGQSVLRALGEMPAELLRCRQGPPRRRGPRRDRDQVLPAIEARKILHARYAPACRGTRASPRRRTALRTTATG